MTEPVGKKQIAATHYTPPPAATSDSQKSDAQEVVDKIRSSNLVGPEVALSGKIDNTISVEHLINSMRSFLSVKMDKVTVDTELLAHINFPNLPISQRVYFLNKVLGNINEIEAEPTKAALAKQLLTIMDEHPPQDRDKATPDYLAVQKQLISLLSSVAPAA